jgi:hypothetical protein
MPKAAHILRPDPRWHFWVCLTDTEVIAISHGRVPETLYPTLRAKVDDFIAWCDELGLLWTDELKALAAQPNEVARSPRRRKERA